MSQFTNQHIFSLFSQEFHALLHLIPFLFPMLQIQLSDLQMVYETKKQMFHPEAARNLFTILKFYD